MKKTVVEIHLGQYRKQIRKKIIAFISQNELYRARTYCMSKLLLQAVIK